MNTEFIGQNIHFAVNLLASLAMFSVFWLIFDAWTQRKKVIETIKWLGFLLLAVGFLVNGAVIERFGGGGGFISDELPLISEILRIFGYIFIVVGQLADPLMKKPTYADGAATTQTTAPAILGPVAILKLVILPILPLMAALLYWRRATIGLERHLKPLAYAFVGLAIFELLSLAVTLQSTANPLVYNLVAVFGPLWWAAQIILLGSSLVFGNWVWRYLIKRLSSQIFIVLVTTTVCIYFASTVGFSYLLLNNTRNQALTDLTTASNVLDYAVGSQKSELAAQAEAVVTRPQVISAAQQGDHPAMQTAIGDYAAKHQLSSVTVTDGDGKILLRSEDPDRWGDSLSDDSLVQRALIGRAATSVKTSDGVLAPIVTLISIQPIRDANNLIVGSLSASRTISNAFVDGIKSATDLDSTVYAGNRRSATTLMTTDGRNRAIGIKETNFDITDTVINKGKSFSGEVTYQNRVYLAAYTPLKDADNTPVGMLLVARPASDLLATATRSVELAFVIAVGLLALSVVPVYLLSKKIAGSVK